MAFTALDADHRLAAFYTSESLSVSLVAGCRIQSRTNHNDPVWLSIVSGTAQREQSRRETLCKEDQRRSNEALHSVESGHDFHWSSSNCE
jgi:hypothetical protein